MLIDDVKDKPPADIPPTPISKELLDQAEARLTAAEKRDARRAARQLKKLEAEDNAKAEVGDDGYPGLDKFLHVIKPAATNKQLMAFIERVENIERELAERSEDRKQIYAEARSCGFDVPTLRKVVALRKMDEQDRIKADALLSTYMHGCGMKLQAEMEF